MSNDRMRDTYFEWMYHLVCDGPCANGRSWRKLLHFLNETEFISRLKRDSNRASDGVDLRYRFVYENSYDTHAAGEYLGEQPSSVLEVMVALALRCEEQIMTDPGEGDRTDKWFWDMIDSLGLSSLHDGRFNRNIAESVITRFLNREYDPDGRGGLFTIEGCHDDLRNVEIWYQMMWHLDNII
jgi:hypothetical protein